MNTSVLIVGGGLAGLTAARLLHRSDIPFQLIEARHRLGGRILTVDAEGTAANSGFDLGPSWFWPSAQPALDRLVQQLAIRTFTQHEEGDLLMQRSADEAAQRVASMGQSYPFVRMEGGVATLIARLAIGLPQESISLSTKALKAILTEDGVELTVLADNEPERTMRAPHVIFALPPRLLEASVSFRPDLDTSIVQQWRATPTWMAPNAKLVAIYEQPFWHEAGLSGAVRSTVGPLVEVHDATTPAGGAALFGFVGVPAAQRLAMGENEIIASSVRQLEELFGPQAAEPIATLYKDWAADPLTATIDDRVAAGHPATDPRQWVKGDWAGRIFVASSETSDSDPGLMAGAVQAAERAVNDLKTLLADKKP